MSKFTFLLLFVSIQVAAQKEKVYINSRIEKVTVFLSGAQVERTVRQPLRAGKYDIVFAGIAPLIDPKSLQLKADGKLTVLSVNHQLNHLREQEVRTEIEQLDTQQTSLQDKINQQQNLKNVYAQEEKLILANQSIKGDATLRAVELKEAADFQRQRLTELYQHLHETERELRKLALEQERINKQLKALNEPTNLSTSEVVVALDVKEASTVEFRLSYLVRQASWYPSYDIRVQDIAHPIHLKMKANIRQQSGEDWKDVKLSLSTGNPDENNTRPFLPAWYLRFQDSWLPRTMLPGSTLPDGSSITNGISGIVRDETGAPVAGASITVKGTNTGVLSNATGLFALPVAPGNYTLTVSYVGFEAQEFAYHGGFVNVTMKMTSQNLQEVVVVGYGTDKDPESDGIVAYSRKRKEATALNTTTVYQPTTTIFEITEAYSVLADGKSYAADINAWDIPATYEYYSVPKLDPGAYLTARVTDWQELNLVPGDVSLFFEGTYLGNSFLDVYNAGDTLQLSLGKDKAVVVKRVLLKEYSSRRFLGGNKTDSRQYELQVRNNKQFPIQLVVEDQFPLSTNKDITIDKLSYEGAKLDDETRKLTWALTVESRKEVRLPLGFSVKYPRDKNVQLD